MPRLQPAVVGGLVAGVLSALPIVAVGNVCCCLWVIAGGVVAAYLLQQNQPGPLAPGDGALVGLIAGVVGAFVYLALSIPIALIVAPMQREMLARVLEQWEGPAAYRDYMGSYVAVPLGVIVGFMLQLFAGAVFSTLGGVIGAAVFRRPSAPDTPQGVIDV